MPWVSRQAFSAPPRGKDRSETEGSRFHSTAGLKYHDSMMTAVYTRLFLVFMRVIPYSHVGSVKTLMGRGVMAENALSTVYTVIS